MIDPNVGDEKQEVGKSEQSLAEEAADFADRLRAGERPDLEAYIRERPEHAEQLRALLSAIARMNDLREPTDGGETWRDFVDVINSADTLEQDEFRILREIGRGGMGIVYEAVQMSLNRRVALKVLTTSSIADPHRIQRFQLEARVLAALTHPNIVPIYSIGHNRGVPYLAMQLIEGRTLAEVARELRILRGLEVEGTVSETTRSMVNGWSEPTGAATEDELLLDPTDPMDATPPPRTSKSLEDTETWPRTRTHDRTVAELGLQAAEALAYAHGLKVIHRDIKPANLLVDAHGHLWITDFGMARLEGESDLTRTGDLVGTLKYMSPEQASGSRVLVDGRTDVYSLGATLYELLTLQPAFVGEDRKDLLRKIIQGTLQPPRSIDPSIPVDLETLVLKAMAREPGNRYPSAREMADDLRRFLAYEPIRARPLGLVERMRQWCLRPERVREAGAALLLLGFVTSGIGAIYYLVYLAGFVKPKHPGDFVRDLLVAFLCFDAPPLWCGFKTLAGKRYGLWLGLATSLNFMIWLLFALCGWNVLDYGGVYEKQDAKLPFLLILLMLVLYTVVYSCIGLAADRASRGSLADVVSWKGSEGGVA
ncbi:serine/threonine protein kinase [Paludisphaera rhizosphaerae]|uniref:serine/threonine protein kinase n=1 Tax=Paludisphaera rhizosphaerae TaxID=2711216 RepID=UPI0013E9CAFE|nr:serine/threonine-protein kinase [Paludisphaera rhizosphaerae]